MKKHDFDRFSKILLATAEAMDKDLSSQRIAIYFDDLIDLDIRAIEFAVKAHRKIATFFPKVAEIRGLARTWRPPSLPGSQGIKMLESPQVAEERRQYNIKKFQEIIDGIEAIDGTFGTEFGAGTDIKERLRNLKEQDKKVRDDRLKMLQEQRQQILKGGDQ